MIIGYDNKYNLAILTASDEEPAFPIARSQDIRLSRLYKSLTTDINISGLNDITASSFFLANHNLTSDAEVYLKGNDDNDFSFPKSTTHTLTNKVTIDCIVRPDFAYDTSINHRLFQYYLSNNQYLQIWHFAGYDSFFCSYQDPNLSQFQSQLFDDGTSYTNINQRLRFTATLDLSSGSQTNSTFRIEPLETGAVFENTAWPSPDILSSTITDLYIGQTNTGLYQWDGNIEYINIYDNQLLTSADIDSGNYTPDFSEVNYPIDYSSDIMSKVFTEQSHDYWRLDISDSTNPDGLIKFGGCFLGAYLSAPDFSHVLTENRIDTSVISRSLSGQVYIDSNYQYKEYNLNVPHVTEIQKDNLISFMTTNAKKPVYILLDETSTTEFLPIYGTIEDISYSRVFNNFYTISIKIREAK